MYRAIGAFYRAPTRPIPPCKTCTVDFKNEKHFLSHECSYACKFCDKSFQTRLDMIEHMIYEDKKNVTLCKRCARFAKQPTSETKDEVCNECQGIVALNIELLNPLHSITMEHKFNCDSCFSEFSKFCLMNNMVQTAKQVEALQRKVDRKNKKKEKQERKERERKEEEERKRQAKWLQKQKEDVMISVEPITEVSDENSAHREVKNPLISKVENKVEDKNGESGKIVRYSIGFMPILVYFPSTACLVNFYRKHESVKICVWICFFMLVFAMMMAITAIFYNTVYGFQL